MTKGHRVFKAKTNFIFKDVEINQNHYFILSNKFRIFPRSPVMCVLDCSEFAIFITEKFMKEHFEEI